MLSATPNTSIASATGLSLSSESEVDISGNSVAINKISGTDVRIYSFVGDGSNATLNTTIVAPVGATGTFGDAIDLDGDRLAIGDQGVNAGMGAVYLYDVTSGDVLDNIDYVADDPANFGSDVALLGDDLLVGASTDFDPSTTNRAGSVSLYNFSETNPYEENPIDLSSGIELNIYSQEAGTLGAGTFSSLADISISDTTASLGGQLNLATFEDIFSLDQMISNIEGMQTLMNEKVNELT